MGSKRVGGWAWRKELEGSSIGVRLRRLNLESFHSKAALRRVPLMGDESAQTCATACNMAIAAKLPLSAKMRNVAPGRRPSEAANTYIRLGKAAASCLW